MDSLDQLDRKILHVMQRDTRLTTNTIGEAVGLSATACQRRINRMRRDGIVESEVAILSPKKTGRPMLMVVEVTLTRGDSRLIERFKSLARRRDEVMQCFYVTGRSDFILQVSMTDMEEYEAFTKDVFFDNPDVQSFETSTVMDRVKTGLAIPVMID